MPHRLFRPWRTKPGWHTVTAPLSPQPPNPKDVAATLCSKSQCCMEPLAPHEENETPPYVHMQTSLLENRWVWERCTPRNARQATLSRPHSRPSQRAFRVPEPPASPGRRVTF